MREGAQLIQWTISNQGKSAEPGGELGDQPRGLLSPQAAHNSFSYIRANEVVKHNGASRVKRVFPCQLQISRSTLQGDHVHSMAFVEFPTLCNPR